MTIVDASAQALLALTNRLVDAGVQPLRASEVWSLLERVPDPADLVDLSPAEIVDRVQGGADGDRIARLLDTGIALAARLDGLRDHGIWTMTVFDESYPARLRDRLGTAAPPVLYGAGEQSLLSIDGIGIVGSRSVDAHGGEVARSAARVASGANLPVVSGGARGVDQISMQAAVESGGTSVGVLAESLERTIGQSETRRALLDGSACLCTPYKPDARFSVGTAMGRNKIIYGLARATLVVAADKGKGGSWEGAVEALKHRFGTVAVWRGRGEGSGNEELATLGAIEVGDVGALADLPCIEPTPRGEVQEQLSLADLQPSSSDEQDRKASVDSQPWKGGHRG